MLPGFVPSVHQGCTHPRCQVNVASVFHMVVPSNNGSLVWKLLFVTLLLPRIFRWLPQFCKIYAPLVWT